MERNSVKTYESTVTTLGIVSKFKQKKISVGYQEAQNHRLNMELDLQSLFGLLCTAVCTHWLRPWNKEVIWNGHGYRQSH